MTDFPENLSKIFRTNYHVKERKISKFKSFSYVSFYKFFEKMHIINAYYKESVNLINSLLWGDLVLRPVSTCERCDHSSSSKAFTLLVKRKMKQFYWRDLT